MYKKCFFNLEIDLLYINPLEMFDNLEMTLVGDEVIVLMVQLGWPLFIRVCTFLCYGFEDNDNLHVWNFIFL